MAAAPDQCASDVENKTEISEVVLEEDADDSASEIFVRRLSVFRCSIDAD